MMARCEEVIICEITKGSGEEKDPVRLVTQFWTKDGILLGEADAGAPRYERIIEGWVVPDWMVIRRESEGLKNV